MAPPGVQAATGGSNRLPDCMDGNHVNKLGAEAFPPTHTYKAFLCVINTLLKKSHKIGTF